MLLLHTLSEQRNKEEKQKMDIQIQARDALCC